MLAACEAARAEARELLAGRALSASAFTADDDLDLHEHIAQIGITIGF